MPARKRMIITGVSSGIGLAVAAEALRLGWHVEGIGRNAPTLLTEHSRGAFTRCDLSDRASLKGLSLVSNQSFDLTVLVNNAGTLGPVKPSYKASWEEIDHCITLNTSSAMLLSAKFLSEVTGEKQIYFTGSGAAAYAIEGWSAYCASKAAVHMYAEVLAKEHPGNRIHAFMPGKVNTPMQAEIRATSTEDFPDVTHFVEEFESGNLVLPETVASTLLRVVEMEAEIPVIFSISNYTT